MAIGPIRSTFTIVLVVIILILLVTAGHLVYRWADRVKVADEQTQRHLLDTALNSVTVETNANMQEVLSAFRPISRIRHDNAFETELGVLMNQWEKGASHPHLVQSVSIGRLSPKTELAQRRTGETDFQSQQWPVDLEPYQTMIQLHSRIKQESPPLPPVSYAFVLSGQDAIFVFPLMKVTVPRPPNPPPGYGPPHGDPHGFGPPMFDEYGRPLPRHPGDERRGPPPSEREMGRRPPPPFFHKGEPRPHRRPPPVPGPRPYTELVGLCFVKLDGHYIFHDLIPQSSSKAFSGPGLSDYRLALLAGSPKQITYQSDQSLSPEWFSSPDASAVLVKPESQFGFPGVAAHQLANTDNVNRNQFEENTTHAGSSNEWVLVARHKSGSLTSVALASRRHNLVIGYGILVLLAISMLVLGFSAQRARTLARKQMEFMAGVTHELGTPLSVIQSAGFNLAEGVIHDEQRVRQYGTVIQNEGRRLSDMVEQILDYAGIESRANRELTPTQISEVVDRALESYSETFERSGWTVKREISPDLPPVLANPHALESAVKNLLQNAVKYGAEGKWIRISANATRNGKGDEVELSVEDHGPGIDPADLPHIFDPFYRGRKVLASNIAGAGLGLSLLRRHMKALRGRVTVRSAPGEGAMFTLHLPALGT